MFLVSEMTTVEHLLMGAKPGFSLRTVLSKPYFYVTVSYGSPIPD